MVNLRTAPAVSHVIHGIAALKLDNEKDANEYFKNSYHGFISAPFNVWCEKNLDLSPDCGQSNYLIGPGAFLQLVMNGYAGIHLNLDHLFIKKPTMLPNSTGFEISGLTYLGAKYSIVVSSETSYLMFLKGLPEAPMYISYKKAVYKVKTLKKCMFSPLCKASTRIYLFFL